MKYGNETCILPLVGTAFSMGKMMEAVERMENSEMQQIARAEAAYFMAQADQCTHIVTPFLDSEDLCLRLSADILYVFSNLTLGNAGAAQKGKDAGSPERPQMQYGKCFLYLCLLCNDDIPAHFAI